MAIPETNPKPNNAPVAVMDLGTNTFHLMIAEADGNGFKELLHLHEPVKLGEGGINKGVIQADAFERGLQTMRTFRKHIDEYGANRLKAMATSALRSTANGPDFITKVKLETGIGIEVIDGTAEAAYIYEGVKASGCLGQQTDLIVDIGGGSVEFIICNTYQVIWKQSFEIGAARLMDKFHQTDPIPADAVAELNIYLGEKLGPLFQAVEKHSVNRLVGSSGAFETFLELVAVANNQSFDLKKIKCEEFQLDDFLKITETIITSNHNQRANNKVILPVRVDMIVVASLLSRFVMERLNIQKVAMSTYSLKEGVLAELLG